MKKTLIVALSALTLTSMAHAGSLETSIGSEYLGLDFNHQVSPNISVTADLLHNFDHDDTMASVGMGYTMPLGAASVTVGGRANWLALDGHSDEMTVSVGGDLQIPLGESLALYGNAYWGPLATGKVDSSFDGRVGVNWRINKAVALDAGYRYSTVEFDNGHQHDLADGAYAGVRVMF
ncbi:YfaZ family protein [Chitinibacter sp. SCUT-21]|uniref:YfaZ family outer membrane protein n=1 Tax=Chitinibacter sp. SCUT-21 TaxID=2970891 RepID=UPI0035A70066